MAAPPGAVSRIVAQARAKAKDRRFYEEGVKYLTTRIKSEENSLLRSSLVLSHSPSTQKVNEKRQTASASPSQLPSTGPLPSNSPSPDQISFPLIPPASAVISHFVVALDVLDKSQRNLSITAEETAEALRKLQTVARSGHGSYAETNAIYARIQTVINDMRTFSLVLSSTGALVRHKAKFNLSEQLAELDFLLHRLIDLETARHSQSHVVIRYVAQRLADLIQTVTFV
eukprot:Gregarina_sp_Poly_1__8915@NODE_539_length_7612_cov_394_304042_g426_i0_p4_GENE_NODE_539_length_7612_cov_394_304042_g426_i0NODE_539_length_7612_cov_394_304042_g426_i0_p4_ORF_typecomplete_len229_score31_63_NODE_539_length_7612_cov_394_304042_g426_i060846770